MGVRARLTKSLLVSPITFTLSQHLGPAFQLSRAPSPCLPSGSFLNARDPVKKIAALWAEKVKVYSTLPWLSTRENQEGDNLQGYKGMGTWEKREPVRWRGALKCITSTCEYFEVYNKYTEGAYKPAHTLMC